MPVLLSDEELQALEGLPHLHRCLYIFGIRRYMDYSTGITGIKRKISYKSLSEEVYINPHQGMTDTKTKSIAQLKRAVKFLEKAGLIAVHSIVTKTEKQLILKCILASWDKSVQNKPVPNPYQSPVPKPAPEIDSTESEEKLYKNSNLQHGAIATEKEEIRPTSRTAQNEKPVPHPLSGKDTILNYTIPPVDNFLTQAENKFLNLFTDLKLSLNLAGDLKAITAAKALVKAGVTIQEAREALETKLAAYKGDRTPHPSYYTQAILDYKRDLEAIKQSSEVNTHETNRPQRPVSESKADSRRNRYNKILR
jgi:hypothetical protein